MKVVFVTCFHAFISKNIINTEIIVRLKNVKDLKIVIFVPENKKDFFIESNSADNIIIEGVSDSVISKFPLHQFFSRLAFLLIKSHYLWYKKVELRKKQYGLVSSLKYFCRILFTKLFGDRKCLVFIYRYCYRRFYKNNLVDSYFKKYKPFLLFSTDIFDEFDCVFLNEAKHNSVRTLGMIRSWDNCYSKGILRVEPDEIIVNNEIIKDELREKHYFPEKGVHIVGWPQFDIFVEKEKKDRDAFFNELGIEDNKKKLILFAPAGSLLSDTDWQVAEMILAAIRDKKIPDSILLVRNHPGHPAVFDGINMQENLIVENPGKRFSDENIKQTELTKRDVFHLMDTLYNSDIVLVIATTLCLDASVYDKPLVMIDFDGYEKKPYLESVKRYHDEDHMKKLLDLGGIRLANNEEELIRSINDYLANPKLDHDGRERIRKEQLWKIDGRSGERVADIILNILK